MRAMVCMAKTHNLTFAAFAAIAVALSLAIAPALTNQASAKIQEVVIDGRCENPAGNEPGGQQPRCKAESHTQITETENQNPSGKAYRDKINKWINKFFLLFSFHCFELVQNLSLH